MINGRTDGGERSTVTSLADRPRWQVFRGYLRTWLMLGASTVVIACAAALLLRELAVLDRGAAWLTHGEQLKFQLAKVLELLNDAGSGVSSYNRTHDKSRFERALAAEAALPSQLSALRALESSEPTETRLIGQLVQFAEQRQVQARDQRDRALDDRLIGSAWEAADADNRRLMDAIRATEADLQTAESALLAEHRAVTLRARNTVAVGIGAAAALAVALIVVIAVTTVRHADRRRRLQEEVEEALLEAARRKDVFLATLAHELRNPLAPIRTAAQLLDRENSTAETRARSAEVITRQVQRMASLLDDLLDVSRITRDRVLLRPAVVELGSILDAAMEVAEPVITAKQHRIHRTDPAQPVHLEVDPLRLTQVVSNLLINAAKFTPAGGDIMLGTQRGAGEVSITVRDTGIGLAPEMLPRVFEMFEQIDSDHPSEGLGIGLALTRAFVTLHGGRVAASSAGLNQGSEFSVFLPDTLLRTAPPPDTSAETQAAASPPTWRILVADDNRDSADIMGALLEQSGHQVHLAYSGLEALTVAATHPLDVALLDIGMPGLNGYDVARRLRSADWGSRLRLIAMTGWGQASDQKRAREAGFDHHLTKPVDLEDLFRALAAAPA